MIKSRLNLRKVAAIAACLAATVIFASCKKDEKEKTVTVGTQEGRMAAGVAGTVEFPITTANIANGSYTVDVAPRPTGVTVQGQVTIDNNGGTLTLAGNTTTQANTYSNLTLTIEGATSAAFTLKIDEPIFLLEKIERGGWRNEYEYDSQNRLIKISVYSNSGLYRFETYRYNAADGHMEEWKQEYVNQPELNENMTWTKNSNKITRTYEYEGADWYDEYELNTQGLPVKLTIYGVYENGNWEKYTRNYTWENGNITQEVWIDEWKEGVEEGSQTWIGIYTYDDKKSPFYHCKTSKWVLLNYTGIGISSLVLTNNIKSLTWDGGTPTTNTYTYNDDGFPATRTRGTNTETFTYKKR